MPANVSLKITPRQYNLLMSALESGLEILKDEIEDAAVKEEDKQHAGQSYLELDRLIRELKG